MKLQGRLSDKLYSLLNNQIKNELDSSRLYLAMSEWAGFNGWSGAAKLWRIYSEEEQKHMHLFYEYLQDRDAMPETPVAKVQPTEFDSIDSVIDMTNNHEVQVSTWIKDIALAALAEKDLHTYGFAMKMMSEQTEEEAKALYWVDRRNMLKSTNTPLYHLDKEFEEKAG